MRLFHPFLPLHTLLPGAIRGDRTLGWKKRIPSSNPEIAANPTFADEVIYKLRAIFVAAHQTGLVRANEEFHAWLTGEKKMPFGENNQHVPVRLIDFDNLDNNRLVSWAG